MLNTLGVTVERLESGCCELGLANWPELTQQHGFIHAGAITTIADSACGYAAYDGRHPHVVLGAGPA